jgi:hypothetical protein
MDSDLLMQLHHSLTYEPGGSGGQLNILEMFRHRNNISSIQHHSNNRRGPGYTPQQALHSRAYSSTV